MPTFEVANPDYEAIVRDSFERQGIMGHIGATLTSVQPGQVSIILSYQETLTQQHGFFHAGVITTIVDSACGYAALSLMPSNSDVLTVEYKVNFVAPAAGEQVRAYGRVVKPGRTITVCQGDVFALNDGAEKLCATMLATMITRPA